MENYQAPEGDKIGSSSRIPLPFLVKLDFEKNVVAVDRSRQMVLIMNFAATDRELTTNQKLILKTLKVGGTKPTTPNIIVSPSTINIW